VNVISYKLLAAILPNVDLMCSWTRIELIRFWGQGPSFPFLWCDCGLTGWYDSPQWVRRPSY